MKIFAAKQFSSRILLVLAILAVTCGGSRNPEEAVRDMAPEMVRARLEQKQGMIILDVRTQQEFDGELGHLPGAILIPVQELDSRWTELKAHKKEEIVVYCRSGRRSRTASALLAARGFKKVRNMTGGILRWNELYKTEPVAAP